MSDHGHLPPTTVRWVLFDYGGVLAEEGFRNVLAALSQRYGQKRDVLPRLAMDAVYDSGYVIGHGSEEAFWELLRRRFPFREPAAVISAEILRGFVLRRPMLGLVDALRHLGYRTGILSDQTDWLERLDARDHFFGHFNRIFNSYYLGKGKRDPKLFEEVVEELSIYPSQAIFIDDNPENIRRAVSCGLTGVVYEDSGKLIRTLASLLDIPAEQLAADAGETQPQQTE